MSKEIEIPDYLKEMMDSGSAKNDQESMEVASGGVPRLTTKGKTFRFKEGDEEVKSGQSIDIVIMGMCPERGLSHTFYKDGYTPDASSPPDCSSMNGIEPDSWIQSPEHINCIKCPNQIWGSAVSMSGGKAKACKDSKQLYVAKAEDFSKDPINCTLYLLNVTINSLKAFSNYGKELSRAGIPSPCFVITNIEFDDEASVPKLLFRMLGILNKDLGPVANERSKEKEWDSKIALPQQPSKRALPEPEPESNTVIKDTVIEDTDESSDLLDNW